MTSLLQAAQGQMSNVANAVRGNANALYGNAESYATRLGITNYAEWASSTALGAGSKAREQAMLLVREKVKAEWGSEIFDMTQALSNCMDALSQELKLKDAKFGISLALPLVAIHHNTLPHVQCQGPLMNLTLVKDACYWVDFALGAYGSADIKGYDKASVNVASGEKPGVEILMASLPQKGVQCPGHFVALDRTQRAVVLGVRGTTTLADAITDALGESVEVPECPGLRAHKAMLASARVVLDKTRATLTEALSANSGYTLLVTGHSLGAGTAILCSILLTATPLSSRPRLRCFAYAPPPVVSPLSKVQVEIHSFINRTDVVPRASLANAFHLGEECMAIDQLELEFLHRFRLMRRDPLPENAAEEQAKQKILAAVRACREKRKQQHHEMFPPLFVPGEVYWIEWLDQPGSVQDSAEPAESKPRIHKVDAHEFQSILLRGGTNALKDHLCGGYKKGLDGYKVHLQENSGCTFCQCQ